MCRTSAELALAPLPVAPADVTLPVPTAAVPLDDDDDATAAVDDDDKCVSHWARILARNDGRSVFSG